VHADDGGHGPPYEKLREKISANSFFFTEYRKPYQPAARRVVQNISQSRERMN
jgi:hypothetical protein